jgi:hypothetical protein
MHSPALYYQLKTNAGTLGRTNMPAGGFVHTLLRIRLFISSTAKSILLPTW